MCGLLLGSIAGACSGDDTKPHENGGGSDSMAEGGSEAGGQAPSSAAGESAIGGSGELPGAGAGGSASGEGGAIAMTDGGASNVAGAGDGDGGEGTDLEVGPALGWHLHQDVVNDQLGIVVEPSLAVDLRGNGDAVLVWSQTNGSNHDIMASRYSAGVWQAPEIIDNLAGHAAQPHVTMDGQGNATAIWQQTDGQNRSGIFYARYVAKTSSWTSAASHQAGPAPYDASNPRVAADAAGNVLATWNMEYGTNDVVTGTRVVASFYSGAAQTPSWTTPQPLSSPGLPQRCGRPRVALSSAGHGFVVWDDLDGGEQEPRRVLAAKYTPGVGFSGTQYLNQLLNAEEPAAVEDVPELAMDDAGNAIVTWRQVGVSGTAGVALSWFAPQPNLWAAQPTICEHRETIGAPVTALDKSGKFAVSFWDPFSGKQELVVVHGSIDDQGGFSLMGLQTVLESASAGSDPTLAVRQDGSAVLAWTQRLKHVDNLLIGQSIPGGTTSVGTLQLDLSFGTAKPRLGVFPGTDLALLTYFEAYDIRSATTSVE